MASTNNFENSKLYQAIKDKNVDEVKDLLSKDEDPSLRNEDGTSYLHAAVALEAPIEIFKLLLEKVDVSIRNSTGQTVADVIFSSECQYPEEAEMVLKQHTKQVILKGEIEKLEDMLLSGWSIWPVTAAQAKEVSEDLESFIEKLPEFQRKIQEIHDAVEKENVRDLKNLLDRKKLKQAADRTGLPPLQKAVVLMKMDILNDMMDEFKDVINYQDGMGRTALHYAGGHHDAGDIYQKLTNAGADDTIKDINGFTPKEYYGEPLKINTADLQDKIKEVLNSPVLTTKQKRVESAKSSGPGHRIYISQDTRPRTGAKPTTIDGKYVADHLGTALTLALAELAERRPKDPIEYLAMYLYKYKENMDHNMKQEALIEALQRAEEMKKEEAEKREKLKAEARQQQEEDRQKRIKEEEERKKKEQEELQRKAKEAALAQRPNLETVAEESEEEAVSREKDSNGQTELHRLAAQEGADITTLLKMGYSIGERDAEQRTARDIAEQSGMTDNVEAIDKFIQDLLKEEKFDDIEQLVLDGYNHIQSVLESIAEKSEDLQQFASQLPDYLKKIQDVFMGVQKGQVRDVQQTLERKKLAIARDNMGRCPLHWAVLTENNDMVEYLAKTFQNTVKCRDHMNRTPLHYAMGLSNEDIITILLSCDADTTVKDVLKRTPSEYRDYPDEIKAMKAKLMADSQESTGQISQEESGQTIQEETGQTIQEETGQKSQEEIGQSSQGDTEQGQQQGDTLQSQEEQSSQ